MRAAFFILLLASTFQNCGNVKLNSVMTTSGSLRQEPPKPTFLKAPTADTTVFRAVFMLDMSFSMIGDVCSSSLVDMFNVVPDRIINNCSEPSGVDYNVKRLAATRKWIQDTEQDIRNRPEYNPSETFKIMIVPFSGPGANNYLVGTDTKFQEALRFVDVNSALLLLDKLEVVNNCYMSRSTGCSIPESITQAQPTWTWTFGESSSFMGTSVPMNGLKRVFDSLNLEMTALGSLRSRSRFELVYLSDGVPKPRVDHMIKAAQIVWDNNTRQNSCTSTCSDAYRDRILYGANNSSGNCSECFQILSSTTLLQNDTECEVGDEGCMRDAFTTGVDRFWGDAKDNDLLTIFRQLNKVKNVFLVQNASVQFRHSFVRIDAAEPNRKTMASDLNENFNWIERSKKAFANNFRYAVINNAEELPFSLFPDIGSSDSYQLKHIVAVNLTTRVNTNGALEIDSDADGLFDSQEVSVVSNTNPQNARSNGFCLDSITFKMRGCVRISCDPQVDEDDDGLNECEEKTVGTSPVDFDTDDDGIPDGLEVIFGYNAMVNDRFKDNNFDGKSNYVNFEHGLVPMTAIEQVNSDYLNRVGVQYVGVKTIVNSLGQRVQVAGYAIQLHSLPLLFPKVITSEMEMYRSLNKTPENLWPFTLSGSNHVAGHNFIYILGKVENAQNPKDFYWVHKRIDAPYGRPVVVDFDLDLLDYIIVPDPQWTGEAQ
jgi:hypothetical protein